MPKYRKMPWQRNLRQVPAAILNKIQQLPTDAFVVGCVKTLPGAQLSEPFGHLAPPGELDAASDVLPPANMGLYSERNAHGWARNKICSKSCAKVERTVNVTPLGGFGREAAGA